VCESSAERPRGYLESSRCPGNPWIVQVLKPGFRRHHLKSKIFYQSSLCLKYPDICCFKYYFFIPDLVQLPPEFDK
jgi:hypothetical protein